MSSRRMAMHSKKPANLTSMAMITVVVILVLAIVFYKSRGLLDTIATYEKKEAYLQEQIAEQEKRGEKIEEYRKYMQTKQYVEDMAKSKLGLVYKDEIIFEADD